MLVRVVTTIAIDTESGDRTLEALTLTSDAGSSVTAGDAAEVEDLQLAAQLDDLAEAMATTGHTAWWEGLSVDEQDRLCCELGRLV